MAANADRSAALASVASRAALAGVDGRVAACAGCRTPPTDIVVTTAALFAAITSCDPARESPPRNGTRATHEAGPTVHLSRPREMFRNALTTVGSNWVPAHRASSSRAAGTLAGFLYERDAVITSKASATATMRAPRVIDSSERPFG
jgi:hypothetical protein